MGANLGHLDPNSGLLAPGIRPSIFIMLTTFFFLIGVELIYSVVLGSTANQLYLLFLLLFSH